MPVLREAAATATDLACRAAGRAQVLRAARFVLRRAGLDVPNDMRTNGEALLQRWILDLPRPGRKLHVIDVGANVGQWSASMLATARQAACPADLDLRAFEPSHGTCERLAAALRGEPVTIVPMAVGAETGTALLHVAAPGAGINSLHLPVVTLSESSTEEVLVTTLDRYAAQQALEHLTLIKVDTEGHDLAVLLGARALLAGHRISVAQFEYNHRWITARRYLRDAFELLEPLGYRIGKLTPAGVEFYPGWDPDLETFTEGNYVACLSAVAGLLPSVAWWKSAS